MFVFFFSVLVFCLAMFVFSIATVVYVAYRFLSLVISLDAAILREFKHGRSPYPQAMAGKAAEPVPDITGLVNPFAGKQPDTEGDFVPHSDEGAFIAEQVELIKQQQGLTDEDMEKFIRQAKGDMSSAAETITGERLEP